MWFGAPPILRKRKMHCVKLVALPQERFKLAKYLIGVVGPGRTWFWFFEAPFNHPKIHMCSVWLVNNSTQSCENLDLLKMIVYLFHEKSTTWGIYREYVLFFGGPLSKSEMMIKIYQDPEKKMFSLDESPQGCFFFFSHGLRKIEGITKRNQALLIFR